MADVIIVLIILAILAFSICYIVKRKEKRVCLYWVSQCIKL